jgi:phage tail protein X
MPSVIAHDHETVDALCMRTLGATAGVVEATLAINPGLAAKGPHLPAGTVVQLPAITAAQKTIQTIQLWD